MAFRRNDDSDPSRGNAAPRPEGGGRRTATTHIAAGSRVVGDIVGSTDLIVEGRVEGKLDMKSGVLVGTSGVVDGEIRARTVRVAGKVNGNVEGLDEIEILPEGRVEGDIVSPRVMISPGAYFKGQVRMGGNSGKVG